MLLVAVESLSQFPRGIDSGSALSAHFVSVDARMFYEGLVSPGLSSGSYTGACIYTSIELFLIIGFRIGVSNMMSLLNRRFGFLFGCV